MSASSEATEKWNEEIRREKQARNYPKWPNEVMLKVLFGGSDYLDKPYKPQQNWKVLDVGCGFANNLVPFADIGCECHGIDLHFEMAATVQEIMDDRGYRTKIQVGSNRSIPYPDGYFDLLLSVSTLHYEGNAENALAALKEFRRVLKPGGGLYICTAGPEHEIVRRAKPLGDNRYLIQSFDFRDGQQFFFFETEKYLSDFAGDVFETVETGRVTEKLMNLPLDFLVALCR